MRLRGAANAVTARVMGLRPGGVVAACEAAGGHDVDVDAELRSVLDYLRLKVGVSPDCGQLRMGTLVGSPRPMPMTLSETLAVVADATASGCQSGADQ